MAKAFFADKPKIAATGPDTKYGDRLCRYYKFFG